MDKFETLYKLEKQKNEQLSAQLAQVQSDYAHLKAIHEILLHRLKIIVDGVAK